MDSGKVTAMPSCTTEEDENIYTYDVLKEIAQFLLDRTHLRPKIGIILGTGIGTLADSVTQKEVFPYDAVPMFPASTVPGHEGQLVFGLLDGIPVMCMQGRFHYFEGYPAWKCAMPVRVMKLVGITHVIASNAAGGLKEGFKVGDIMIIKDHVNFLGMAGLSPLRGRNEDRFGPRFPPMNFAYDVGLRNAAKVIAEKMGIAKNVHEGVYICVGGPQFETVAELKFLKAIGIDSVGMSTVHEVTTAHHCEMKVFAFSLITNMCVMDYESLEQTNHVEVLQSAKEQEGVLKIFVTNMVKYIKFSMK